MRKLISPLVDFMTKGNMVTDVTNPISVSVKQKTFTFEATGINQLQIWKPYFFDADDEIDNSIIKGIEVVQRNDLIEDPKTGNPLLASADLYGNFLLWIVNKENDVLVQTPLFTFISTRYGAAGHGHVQRTYLDDVCWQKCYITCHNTLGVNIGDSILFNVYLDPKKKENA